MKSYLNGPYQSEIDSGSFRRHFTPNSILGEMAHRQKVLTAFAFFMLMASIPTGLALAWDERTLREVSVWWKPLKFMLSTSIFSATTAWFFGWLPEVQRYNRASKILVATLIATATFEVAYISIQAALGQASHYNVSDPLHAALFVMMAIAAWALTGTQAVLAWRIYLASKTRGIDVITGSVITGLCFTFVLGSASGMMLGAFQPPAGEGLPLLGWHMTLKDVRPAHFLGVHAQQLVPLIGLAIAGAKPRNPAIWLTLAAIGYLLLWGILAAQTLGRS